MDYNRQTIANEIASFKYTMKQTNDDISPAEIIDGLMQWVEQYTNVLHEISVAETLDDLKELKQNAACPDIRPDVAIWALRRIVSKLESGAIKPDDPQVKEVLQQLIERRRIGNEFNAELTRLVHEQSDEPTRTPR